MEIAMAKGENMFKTELHCHSKSISQCARVSNEEIIEKFTEAGYTTLVLANHFTEGTQNNHGCQGDYQAFVTKFLNAYEDLKKDAEGKLTVLLAMELRFNENSNDYLVFGILTTALISLLTILFKTHHSHFVEIFGKLHRLKLLTGNENSLAIYCSIALSIYISNILTKKDHLIKNIILGLATLSFGISTKSKCFLIVCCFIMVYLFLMLIVKYKLKSFKFIIPAIVLFVIFSLIFDGAIDATINRFVIRVDDKLSLSALTTGRSTLWTMYFNEITSSIRKLLLGVGLFSERLVRIGPHNLFIHLLYRMGLIGIFLLGLLCYFYYQAAKGTRKSLKPTLKTSLTLVVFIMISMVESFL